MKQNYLRQAGRWTGLLVVLPVVCVAGALLQDRDSATTWTGSASVLAAPALTDRGGAQYVNDVQAALVSDAVVDQVAGEVGVSPTRIQPGLSSEVLAPGSSVLGVTFRAQDRALADRVPEAAARAALRALVQPQLEQAQAQVRSAEDDSERALQARDAFTDENGVQLPLQSYTQGLAEVAQLRVAAATARFEGRDGADGLAGLLAEREQAVAALAPQVPEFEALDAEVQRTYVQLNQVRTDLVSAQAEMTAIDSGPTVVASPAVAGSATRVLVQRAVSAAIVGLLAAVLLLALIVLVLRRRPADSDPASGGSTPFREGQGGHVGERHAGGGQPATEQRSPVRVGPGSA